MNDAVAKGTPKDIFLYLSWAISLYVSLSGFVWLLFKYIDLAFTNSYSFTWGIKWSIAQLVVTFPFFLIVSWLIRKDIALNPEKLHIKSRKWFVSLTLFVVSGIFVGNLVYLLYEFLNWGITTRFVLKSLTILVATGGVFGYYILDIKGLWINSAKPKLIAWLVTILVLASVSFGFYIVGAPWQQYNRKMDRSRISDLQTLKRSVLAYYQQNNKLPAKLNDLKYPSSFFIMPTDPDTEKPYEYKFISPNSFALCAIFKAKSYAPREYPNSNTKWSHKAGYNCFTLKAE